MHRDGSISLSAAIIACYRGKVGHNRTSLSVKCTIHAAREELGRYRRYYYTYLSRWAGGKMQVGFRHVITPNALRNSPSPLPSLDGTQRHTERCSISFKLRSSVRSILKSIFLITARLFKYPITSFIAGLITCGAQGRNENAKTRSKSVATLRSPY